MDFDWTAQEQDFRAQLRQFVELHMRPGWKHTDRDMPTDAEVNATLEFCRGLADAGLLTPQWPARYGGRDATLWEQTIISEELWGSGEPRGAEYMNVNWIGPAIMALGTDDQKDYHLKRISAGDVIWCQGFSEPEAGSDLGALKTRADRDGDTYIVNGQKVWTSYAHAAEFCFLLARTASGDARNSISILLVPMNTPGIEVREIPTIGVHHLVHEVFFDDVVVPTSCRLGEENQGWAFIRTILANERVGNARHEWCDRMLDAAVEESDELGKPRDDRFYEVLGRTASYVAAGRILNYAAVDAAQRNSADRNDVTAVYRAQMAQMEMGAAHALVDLVGSDCLVEGSRGDYQMLGGLLSTIGGGSYEMQLNNIARFALELPKGT